MSISIEIRLRRANKVYHEGVSDFFDGFMCQCTLWGFSVDLRGVSWDLGLVRRDEA
jgi:hypothetical protein